jgi:hypothetical protein
MPNIAERIDSYFIQMEWPFERVDTSLWHTAYQGDLQLHEVFVSLDEDKWVSLRSMVSKAPSKDCKNTVYEHLLRLNSLIPLTKFCIMENGDIFAMVDLPTADLHFTDFRMALQTIINHVDAYDNEILSLCKNSQESSSLATTGMATS